MVIQIFSVDQFKGDAVITIKQFVNLVGRFRTASDREFALQ